MSTIKELEDRIDMHAHRGDWDKAEAAQEALTTALDARVTPTLHQTALWYAEQGLHVFPLAPGTKIPVKGTGGCLDATNDADMVNKWWTGNPRLNIGIATGHMVDVVDVDGHEGQESRASNWCEKGPNCSARYDGSRDCNHAPGLFADIDADNIGKVLTPRKGGMHIYVPATGDGNTTNMMPKVDYRGKGGYVVAPPSVTDVDAYRWLGTPTLVREVK